MSRYLVTIYKVYVSGGCISEVYPRLINALTSPGRNSFRALSYARDGLLFPDVRATLPAPHVYFARRGYGAFFPVFRRFLDTVFSDRG